MRCALLLLLSIVACSENADEAEPVAAPVAADAPAGAPANGLAAVTGRAPVSPGYSTIVVLEPSEGTEMTPRSGFETMDQAEMAFDPGLLLVQTGQPVRFSNSEDQLHNVNVLETATREQVFNVATPPSQYYEHVFERPGFYAVSCDIHPAMRATIFVAESPYLALADAQGRFEFADVAPGRYTVATYSAGQRREQIVEVRAPATEVRFGP